MISKPVSKIFIACLDMGYDGVLVESMLAFVEENKALEFCIFKNLTEKNGKWIVIPCGVHD